MISAIGRVLHTNKVIVGPKITTKTYGKRAIQNLWSDLECKRFLGPEARCERDTKVTRKLKQLGLETLEVVSVKGRVAKFKTVTDYTPIRNLFSGSQGIKSVNQCLDMMSIAHKAGVYFGDTYEKNWYTTKEGTIGIHDFEMVRTSNDNFGLDLLMFTASVHKYFNKPEKLQGLLHKRCAAPQIDLSEEQKKWFRFRYSMPELLLAYFTDSK
jgi:hypothetical protein